MNGSRKTSMLSPKRLNAHSDNSSEESLSPLSNPKPPWKSAKPNGFAGRAVDREPNKQDYVPQSSPSELPSGQITCAKPTYRYESIGLITPCIPDGSRSEGDRPRGSPHTWHERRRPRIPVNKITRPSV